MRMRLRTACACKECGAKRVQADLALVNIVISPTPALVC